MWYLKHRGDSSNVVIQSLSMQQVKKEFSSFPSLPLLSFPTFPFSFPFLLPFPLPRLILVPIPLPPALSFPSCLSFASLLPFLLLLLILFLPLVSFSFSLSPQNLIILFFLILFRLSIAIRSTAMRDATVAIL